MEFVEAFQNNAFQNDAFQMIIPSAQIPGLKTRVLENLIRKEHRRDPSYSYHGSEDLLKKLGKR